MKRVLLVDDEPMVVDVLRAMLTNHGHAVMCATDSSEALVMIEEDYDLYLFDLRMPEPSGAELAECVLARRPDATVLIMTAFPGDPLAARALRSGVAALVKKPFEIGKILSYLGGNGNESEDNDDIGRKAD